MTARACPVCNTDSSAARMFLEQNIDPERLTSFSFASRKLPEFMSHRMVLCPGCDLVYADDPPDESILAEAYHVAEFDSDREADDAAAAYDLAVAPILARLKSKSAALEIGTGTGIFLDSLVKRGFETVVGVEPSPAAIAAAPARRRAWIREAIFRQSDFAPESFDLICCFMTLEHVRDPQKLVSGALSLLKPGGAIAVVTHDYRSFINRLLGKRSPIIDIEHLQLFSPQSIRALLEMNGYDSVSVSSFVNRYAIGYWVRLLPLGLPIKQAVSHGLKTTGMADLKMRLNVGNMLAYGYRPDG